MADSLAKLQIRDVAWCHLTPIWRDRGVNNNYLMLLKMMLYSPYMGDLGNMMEYVSSRFLLQIPEYGGDLASQIPFEEPVFGSWECERSVLGAQTGSFAAARGVE